MRRRQFCAAACLVMAMLTAPGRAEAASAPEPVEARAAHLLASPDASMRAEGLALLTAAAERGQSGAQAELGRRLALGLGVPKDEAAARTWLMHAARGDHAGAKVLLAELELAGRGGPNEPVSALRWLAEAADQGDGGAQERLGTLYAEGELVPRDDVTALVFFELAARAGRRGAGVAAAQLREGALRPAQLAEGRRRVRAWLAAHPDAARAVRP